MNYSIITPLFNRMDLTAEFLQSVFPLCGSGELILIDNNSSDNTEQLVSFFKKNRDPEHRVVYHKNDTNLGFGKANNIGAKLARSNILIFISNDVKILGNFMNTVYKELKDNEIIGPHLLSYDTGWNTYHPVGVIPYVEGFFMAMKKDVFDKIGGFWEELFIDMEDLELCYRASQRGICLRQVDLPVRHSLGGSFGGLSRERMEITLESREKVMKKYGWTLL